MLDYISLILHPLSILYMRYRHNLVSYILRLCFDVYKFVLFEFRQNPLFIKLYIVDNGSECILRPYHISTKNYIKKYSNILFEILWPYWT